MLARVIGDFLRLCLGIGLARGWLDSEALVREWTVNWDDLIDFEIISVRTSAEAAAAIAPEL
jgi:hypothetical protein